MLTPKIGAVCLQVAAYFCSCSDTTIWIDVVDWTFAKQTNFTSSIICCNISKIFTLKCCLVVSTIHGDYGNTVIIITSLWHQCLKQTIKDVIQSTSYVRTRFFFWELAENLPLVNIKSTFSRGLLFVYLILFFFFQGKLSTNPINQHRLAEKRIFLIILWWEKINLNLMPV